MRSDIRLSALPWFEDNAIEAFGSELSYWTFQEWILDHPDRGKVVPGTGGARKVRWQDPERGKGSRGGLRIMYFWFASQQVIVLASVYGKDRKEDLTPEDTRVLRHYSARLRRELERSQTP